MNLPARCDGDHLCLGQLVIDEAQKMAAAGARIEALEDKLWQWLKMGWTRLRDDGVLVFWRPDVEDFVPFSPALHDYYTSAWEDTRAFVGQRLEQAKAEAHHAALLAETDGGEVH